MPPQYQTYPDIIPQGTVTNANSIPILCAGDFKTAQFTLVNGPTANYIIKVFQSNQELPPNLAVAASATNQYTQIGYTTPDQSFYAPTAPYNPNTNGTGITILNVEMTGARWIILQISGYVAGTMLKADANLFSNFF